MAVICLFWGWDSFHVAHRFWLPCNIFKKSWALAILCNCLSCASLFISKSFAVSVVSNAGLSTPNIRLLIPANFLTGTLLQRVLRLVFHCLEPISSRPREKLVSTATPCGMIQNMSHSTLERSAYYTCISTCWCHEPVISGIHNVLLIAVGLEWYSSRSGLICPKYFFDSGCEIKWSLAAVNKRASWSLCPGVISAACLGVKYSSSSWEKSYGSKDDWLDREAVAEGTRLLLCMLMGLMKGKCLSLAQYSFSTYFRNACWYWVVLEVSSSRLRSIWLSHFQNDHNSRKGLSLCAEMRSITVIGVTWT